MGANINRPLESSIKERLELSEIAPSDLEQVAQFVGGISGSTTPIPQAVQRLEWILRENPARSPTNSLGWLLRTSSGELVGCMACAPENFCCGDKIFTLLMANSFYVDHRHRGSGTSIFMKFLQLGRRYPLFVSSANPTVAEMWKRLGGYPLGNSDQELMAVLRWSPVITEAAYHRTRSDLVARATTAVLSPLSLLRKQSFPPLPECEWQPLTTPQEATSVCAAHRSEKITASRDLPFLKWRYFSSGDQTTRLFAIRPGSNKKRFMVAVRLQNRGYRRQIRALQVLDIWGEPDSDSLVSIAACLCREYRDQVDMLVFRCLDSIQVQALKPHGFRARPFPAPVAWCIDKYKILPAKPWYFTPADGDMFL